MHKIGILLVNLGTPEAPTVPSIRRYLREFLLDPRVIDIAAPLRYLLVYSAILPFRAPKTTEAYQAIWQKTGSPLRFHLDRLTSALQAELGETYRVVGAMRYGTPSMHAAMAALQSCEEILLLPLFPQYSEAATGSAIAYAQKIAKKQSRRLQQPFPRMRIVRDFYNHPAFIHAYTAIIRASCLDVNTFLLFSYHGLPERHIAPDDCAASCDRSKPCPVSVPGSHACYRAQCYQTSRSIAQELALSSEQYTTAFQSRLGRTPWIKPYTDETLVQLYRSGIRSLAVVCPAFVADCLETLEEIGMQAREQWKALGGTAFHLIPCLNHAPEWVSALAEIVKTSDIS